MRRKLIVGALTGFAFVLASASAASAHVTVNPKTAEPDAYAKLTFRVPNERPNANTTKVEINIPSDHPIASVSVQPQPGWTYAIEKSKFPAPVTAHGAEQTDGISKITWTADANSALKAGEFGEFNISVGPLPKDATSIVFKALQTYSSGEVVRWIDVAANGEEVDHPAPVLKLEKAASTTTIIDKFAEEDEESDALSIAALAIAILAVALALAAVLTRKRT